MGRQLYATCICQKSSIVLPLNLKAVEADHVFQIHEYHDQAVELISQPEICEAYLVEGSSEHSKLSGRKREKGIIHDRVSKTSKCSGCASQH